MISIRDNAFYLLTEFDEKELGRYIPETNKFIVYKKHDHVYRKLDAFCFNKEMLDKLAELDKGMEIVVIYEKQKNIYEKYKLTLANIIFFGTLIKHEEPQLAVCRDHFKH